MTLALGDWLVIAAYCVFSGVIGFAYAKRASADANEYFLSGRKLPWWLSGTSMVATTFAADTPLAVAGMVASNGIAGNWLWWNMAIGNVLTVFFFARLWRRAAITTDAELIALRYSGREANALRKFRALYMALPINLIVIGWVNLAMLKILGGTLGMNPVVALGVMGVVIFAYSAISGLWGVVVTDAVQFVLAMVGCIVLAIFAVDAVGGVDALVARLPERYGTADAALSFMPERGASWMPLTAFLAYLSVQWWASSYPGSEPGGGGYIAQRMLSVRTERDSVLATLWFTVAHYAVRPWPWIMTGLAVVVLYGREDAAGGFVQSISLLPFGLRGLLIASFAAAYMSTISTQLNWGASYLVNDVFPVGGDEATRSRRAVARARVMTAVTFLLSSISTYALWRLGTIEAAWRLLIALGAGTGPVLILRWYWSRISAWSEISAMAASLVIFSVLTFGRIFDPSDPLGGTYLMLITTALTTIVWVTVTFLTPPTEPAHLEAFYTRVRPGGAGWKAVRERLGIAPEKAAGGAVSWAMWFAGVVCVYASLFGVGRLIFGQTLAGMLMLGAAAASFAFIAWGMKRTEAKAAPED